MVIDGKVDAMIADYPICVAAAYHWGWTLFGSEPKQRQTI